MVPHAGHRVVLQPGERRIHALDHELASPAGVNLELLDPLRQRSEMLEQQLARLPSALQVSKRPRLEQAMDQRADDHEHQHGQQDLPREPREVEGASNQDRAVHGQRRNVDRRPPDDSHVIRQRRQHSRHADLLEPPQRSRQDLATEGTGETSQCSL